MTFVGSRPMGTLYALLVGIDDYRAPLNRLEGAVRDIRFAEALLRDGLGSADRLEPRVLLDGDATRGAVIAGLRDHLGLAGAGDRAVFWFSGHGSQVVAPPGSRTETTGTSQTLVCADSRIDGVPDLLDEDVAALLSGVAARGPHVLAVLDCCHSEGGTRDVEDDGVRAAPPMSAAWSASFGTTRSATSLAPAASHVLLAACRIGQVAKEVKTPEGKRGVFSRALLDQLARCGSGVTYRDLLGAVGRQVENSAWRQNPIGYGELDTPFLGGAVVARRGGPVARFVRGGWRLDLGACHGLRMGPGGEEPEFGVTIREGVRRLKVLEVETSHSVVEPVGWTPDPDTVYPTVLTRIPLPTTTVALCGPGLGTGAGDLLAAAVATSAPGGTPSPHVRLVADDPDLRVVLDAAGTGTLCAADRSPLAPATPVTTSRQAAAMIARAEHVARWRAVRALANPASALAGRVRLDVEPVGSTVVSRDEAGSVLLEYRWEQGKWVAPQVTVSLSNTHDQPLFCAVLNLTDRYRIHASLLRGDSVAPDYRAYAARGQAIRMALPVDRAVVPGAACRDWLMLLVSEQPFSSEPFELPSLGEPERESRRSSGFPSVLEQLGLAALHRTARSSPVVLCDWATGVVSVETRVPGAP